MKHLKIHMEYLLWYIQVARDFAACIAQIGPLSFQAAIEHKPK